MDCKILTKILATRLEKALPNIIHTDQVGFMKNRSSTDNMIRLLHLICLNRTGKDPVVALSLDDILMLIKHPSISIPHLMNAIQSCSRLSGYKINWTKSEAMPISGLCNSSLLTNVDFKWVSKGMKYLGIKLSSEVEEMPTFNLEPLLQKYKITHRFYWTPQRLNRAGIINNNLCRKCQKDIGTLLHCICVIQPFWKIVYLSFTQMVLFVLYFYFIFVLLCH